MGQNTQSLFPPLKDQVSQMSSTKNNKANWNVWGKANVRTERAAPVVLFDETSRKYVFHFKCDFLSSHRILTRHHCREYVTGFTKRKQQRRLIAQVAIKTKEKQMRSDERKKVRLSSSLHYPCLFVSLFLCKY